MRNTKRSRRPGRVHKLRRQEATRRSVVVFAMLCAVGSQRVQAGDLNPPPGPIGPTMKTLTEVEPRIAINAISTPGDATSLFKIVQPGSYYLAGNIIGVSGKAGIQIAVAANGPGVTIDLMGFELVGVPGSTDGIVASGSDLRNIAIRNGTVRAWGDDGVDLLAARNTLLAGLRVQNNGDHGIWFAADSAINGCAALGNTSNGIVAVRSTVTGCAASQNGGAGIWGAESTITGCTSDGNIGDGIYVQDTGTISNCTAAGNGGDGIEAGSGTVVGCTVVRNTGHGILGGSACSITGCTVMRNGGNGIDVSEGCRVADNTCMYNGLTDNGSPVASGIYTGGSRNCIEGNHLVSNGFGIYLDVAATGNVVIRNYAGGSTSGTEYTIPSSGNFLGTIAGNSFGMNSATNSTVNIAN